MAELDATGLQLLELVGSEVERQVAKLDLPSNVGLQRSLSAGPPPPPQYHHATQELAYVRFSFHISSQANTSAQMAFYVLVANYPNQVFTFLVGNVPGEDTFEVRLEEMRPEETPSFRLRMESWVRSILGETLDKLRSEVVANQKPADS